jgi:hypothetical protein
VASRDCVSNDADAIALDRSAATSTDASYLLENSIEFFEMNRIEMIASLPRLNYELVFFQGNGNALKSLANFAKMSGNLRQKQW